ncbi:hypothetical protein D9611_004848 [Ephemerocybe angulata]|uniref:Uncharacterized protein n=1 Tax=Ephemerocybe angulata TaxID=980116 RepID=A0A8H5B332_9AGAR|nr:hypothetical protein D9611_004848 [Tulosesus angulatus]
MASDPMPTIDNQASGLASTPTSHPTDRISSATQNLKQEQQLFGGDSDIVQRQADILIETLQQTQNSKVVETTVVTTLFVEEDFASYSDDEESPVITFSDHPLGPGRGDPGQWVTGVRVKANGKPLKPPPK